METYTIKDYEDGLKKAEDRKDPVAVKRYKEQIDSLKKKLPHSCGSEEFYMAPIVHIRCAKCNQPL